MLTETRYLRLTPQTLAIVVLAAVPLACGHPTRIAPAPTAPDLRTAQSSATPPQGTAPRPAQPDYPAAIAHVRNEPRSVAAQMELGRTCLALGRVEEAAAAFHAASVLDPKSLEPHREMASLYLAIGLVDRTVATLERLRTLAPNDVETLVRLGRIYVDLAWQDRAGPLLTKAVALAPESPAAVYEMARYEWETAHSEAAVRRLKAFHERQPDDPRITSKLAEYLMALQHDREAETLLLDARSRQPDSPAIQRALAYNWIKQADAAHLQSAIDLLNKMLVAGVTDAEVYCRLGQAYERLKRYPEAVTAYEASMRRDPTFESSALSLGRLYLRNGQKAKGEKLIRFYTTINANMQTYSQAHETVRKQFNSPEAHLKVAALNVKANRLPEAVLEYRRVLTLRPHDRQAEQGLQQALKLMGRQAEAKAIPTS